MMGFGLFGKTPPLLLSSVPDGDGESYFSFSGQEFVARDDVRQHSSDKRVSLLLIFNINRDNINRAKPQEKPFVTEQAVIEALAPLRNEIEVQSVKAVLSELSVDYEVTYRNLSTDELVRISVNLEPQ